MELDWSHIRTIIVRLVAAGLLLATALPAAGQPAPKVYRVGFLTVGPASPSTTFEAFSQGMREAGYVEGRNVVVQARFAGGSLERIPGLVAELLELKPDVLVAGSPAVAAAAKKASATVPIVFAGVGDPVASGIVASLARPGGNVTGTAVGVSDPAFGGKWLQLLKEAVPGISHVAVLANRSNRSNSPYFMGIEAAARAMKVRIDVFDAGNEAQLEQAFAAIAGSGAQGMIVSTDPFLFTARARLVSFAASKRLPAMYFFKNFVDEGGFMSYGANIEDSYRRAAPYVDKILKGAKPGELAVEQPTRFEFAINKATARALGIGIPRLVLMRADYVNEGPGATHLCAARGRAP